MAKPWPLTRPASHVLLVLLAPKGLEQKRSRPFMAAVPKARNIHSENERNYICRARILLGRLSQEDGDLVDRGRLASNSPAFAISAAETLP